MCIDNVIFFQSDLCTDRVISYFRGKKIELDKMTKIVLSVVLLAVAFLMATSAFAAEDPVYGSYVVICNPNSANVTFVNYPQYGCLGEASLYVMPLNVCHHELLIFSWNAVCNNTNMWYNNFPDTDCAGSSVLTRMYVTFSCQNCTNPECKNGPFGFPKQQAVKLQ